MQILLAIGAPRRQIKGMNYNRRTIIAALGATAALGVAAWRLRPVPEISFETATKPEGFRRIAGGGMSTGGAILTMGQGAGPRLDDAALCDVAFAGQTQGAGQVIIASFSDFFCPYCRELETELHAIAKRDSRVSIVAHEVPLLGFPSVMAAKGAIAASQQGAYETYYARLIRTTFIPNAAYLEDFARGEGLDVPRFMDDLEATATLDQLRDSLAAFRSFGFVGTPGIAVGGTLVNGVIAPRVLRRLVEIEIAADAPC